MPDYIFVAMDGIFPVLGFSTLGKAAAELGFDEFDLTELFASENDPWLRMWVTPNGEQIFKVQILND